METVLIHSAFGLWPMFEYELDIVQRELDAGNHVIFLHCFGNQTDCPANNPKYQQTFKERYCKECRSRVVNGIKWLDTNSGLFEHYEYEHLSEYQETQVNELMSKLENIEKDEKYVKPLVNDIAPEIFEAALSQFISTTRNTTLDLAYHWPHFRSIIRTAIQSHFSANYHINKLEPNKVYIYNGRMARYRPLLRLCQRKKIDLMVYEYPFLGGAIDYSRYVMSKGNYYHDRANFSRQLFEYYIGDATPETKKLDIGAKWYEERLHKSSHPFLKKMKKKQNKGQLPIEWDQQKFNISFFVSSEYEWAQIPEALNQQPYTGQCDFIEHIKNNITDRAQLYIRIHPNLIKDEKKFVARISEFNNDQVVVISPESNVDTYQLAIDSDLIICFGSTVGIESAFLKKPVIVIGASLYSSFQATSNPSTHNDVVKLINNAIQGELSAFPAEQQRYEGACAYAWTMMNYGIKAKYLKRRSYLGGSMIRNGKETNIKANLLIYNYNRLLDAPLKFVAGIRMVLNDPEKRAQFTQNPLSSIKDKIFGELPS